MPFFIFEKFILIKNIPSDFTRRREFGLFIVFLRISGRFDIRF